MTDATITELRPSPAKGEGSRKPDRTNAERQRRFKQRRKAGNAVTRPAVTPAPTVTVTPVTWLAAIDVAAYTAAIALAGAAAFFSIRGMTVIFPAMPTAVVGMAVAMESAKLVTAGWLARRWRSTAWIWRLVLVALVAGLAVINAAGVMRSSWPPMWENAAASRRRSRRKTRRSPRGSR
jgi:hypothetical protein